MGAGRAKDGPPAHAAPLQHPRPPSSLQPADGHNPELLQDGAGLGGPCGGACPRRVGSLVGSTLCVLQVLRYFDYVFTGVFTFEMVIKVRAARENRASGPWKGHLSASLVLFPGGVTSQPAIEPLLIPALASGPGDICHGRTLLRGSVETTVDLWTGPRRSQAHCQLSGRQ